MNIELSCRDDLVYTSSKTHDDLTVQMRGSELDQLEEAHIDVKGNDDIVTFNHQGTHFPAQLFLPLLEGQTQANIAVGIHRGPNHPEEICETDVTLLLRNENGKIVAGKEITVRG